MTKKSLLTVTCLHFTVFVLSIISVNAQYHVLVRTEHGEVEGFTVRSQYEAYDRRRVNVFLGVPYAKQPTQYQDWRREFRFNKPEKPSWTGTWKADKYGPACPQLPWFVKQTVPSFSRAATSEDCLYMNIFTPNATDEQPVANPNLFPVMVFIHGGGWTMGASQQYPGIFLAERRVVVVTFNYRLNALGFLSTADQYSPGNYGLWDQHRALEFVKENIRSFRGNPNMVTIFGHSTGAASVGLHLLSPRSYNLFHQAIMMSGSDRTQWAVLPSSDDASYYASELARETGCPPNDNYRLIRCLQEYRSADEIVNASARVRVREGTVGSPWSPVVDGPFQGSQYAFMTDQPRDMRSQGRFQKLRVMGGLTKDDGSYFIPNMPSLQEGLSPTQFDNILLEFLRDQNVKDMVNALEALRFEYSYWPQRSNYSWVRQEMMDMMSDYLFGTGMDETLRSQNLYNRTYMYLFNYKSRYDYVPTWRGVAHGQELQYVFGYPFINQTYRDLFGVYPRQVYDIDFTDRNISEYMISLFTNFSNSGNPTDSKYTVSNFGNIPWLEYNLQNHSYLEIGNKTQNRVNFRQRQYVFWREYFLSITNRGQILTTTTSKPLSENEFQIATYSVGALAAVLLIICIALTIVIWRMRPKDY
ncbi:acetylcholinesterase-like [Mya arenaria]|uniref:acetylcholinesterase-like n=1 Tax=Mya arenaria TaxID=6604 RepID=UPI0022E52832|nr:acetylcholinesterase-like [Mya arenaria]XP_052764969.1 acetylcholinesterase-like [Mya arenaria]